MKIKFKIKKIFNNKFIYIFLLGFYSVLNAQDTVSTSTIIENSSVLNNNILGTLGSDTTKNISIKSPSGIDTTINFYSSDTTIYKLRAKKILLKGNAKVDFKNQSLTAAIIEIDFENSILYAKFDKDTTGKIIGIPKFNDAGEEFFGEELTYNLKTKTGLIKSGETKMGEGFYYGDSIKRISENELLVKNGYYTTCDAAKPHYHFGSTEMKMLVGDRIFVDPLYFYVDDIPIFMIPFGMFLPITRGRSSGLIVPSFYFSNNRGVVFQDFGFYWAASDYWDARLTADLYTKGGYLLNLTTNWGMKNIFNGESRIKFGKTRYSIDEKYSNEWSFGLNHEHLINPFERANINLDFASQDFNRNTSTNLNDRIKQNINSRASYSRTFENGVNASLSFSNDQNIITNEYQGSIPLSVSVPQFQPVKKIFSIPSNTWYSWLKDITFRYTGNAYYNFDKKQIINTYHDDVLGETKHDTVFSSNNSKYISHSPQISISPKFGYFTVIPSINFNANNYFRKMIRTYNSIDSTTSERFADGFFTEYNYSFGVGIATRIYGIADEKRKLLGFINPNYLGIKAIRHTYQPNISISYSPDFSGSKYDFYGRYYDEKRDQEMIYSYFEREGGSHASRQTQKRLSYSDVHSFEIKKKSTNDSLPDENLELLRLSMNTSYNFAADSLNFSDIGLVVRTPSLKFLEFSGSANFTLYDELNKKNSSNDAEYYTRVNQFLLNNNKGLARLTNFRLDVSTSFSSNGLLDASSANTKSADSTSRANRDTVLVSSKDTTMLELGSRFSSRNEASCDGDLFGLYTSGYSTMHIPWDINLGLSFTYNNSIINKINRDLDMNISFNFVLAETWNISTRFHYNFIKKQVITPQINLNKDFHCWDLTASWYPIGYNQGFYLRFGIKSSQLRDLKIEKRDSPIFR